MKKIKKMIKEVKKMISDVVIDFFAPNDDSFLEALGVDPEKYKHVAPDGTVGYDFMTALNDTAVDSWCEYMADYVSEIKEEEMDRIEVYPDNGSSVADWTEDPRNHHSWNILSVIEKELALQKYAEGVGLSVEKLPKLEAEKQKEKIKYKKMFNWG